MRQHRHSITLALPFAAGNFRGALANHGTSNGNSPQLTLSISLPSTPPVGHAIRCTPVDPPATNPTSSFRTWISDDFGPIPLVDSRNSRSTGFVGGRTECASCPVKPPGLRRPYIRCAKREERAIMAASQPTFSGTSPASMLSDQGDPR
jgi:hypothetical protein